MARVERLSLPPGKRVVVISDIHGNLPYLRALLEKAAVTPEDVLILLGDLVEKGPESLATLRYVMGLRERFDLHVVQGNCDAWHREIDCADATMHEWVRRYMLRRQPHRAPGLLAQMCRECGLPVESGMDMERMRAVLRERYAPEWDFLRALPHILDAGTFVFVHGGLPPEGEDWESADPWPCMKCDRFADRGRRFARWVVVGHTPVQLYREDITSAVPIVDGDSRLISIDGGCVLKDDGQLNALLLRDGEISWTWYDPFPLMRALDAQAPSAVSRYIPWGDNAVEDLGGDGAFRRIRQRSTGYEMEVPADFLYEREGELLVNDCTDYRPAVSPGELLALVRQTGRGAWIKKNGVSGWYGGRLAPLEPGALSP